MTYSIDGYNYLLRRFNRNRRLQPRLKEYREKLEIYLKEQYMMKLNDKNECIDLNDDNNNYIIDIKQDGSFRLNLDYFCGSENNILERVFQASQEFKSDVIIRITGDCPLIDFNTISKAVVQEFVEIPYLVPI